MITGIIFACIIEKGVCVPLMKEFETVEECLIDTSQALDSMGKPEGFLFYRLCEARGEPA